MITRRLRPAGAIALAALPALLGACASRPPSPMPPTPPAEVAEGGTPEPPGVDGFRAFHSSIIVVLAEKRSPFSRPFALESRSRWSTPIDGVACRVSLPTTVGKGDWMRAVVEFQVDPGALPRSVTHLDGRRPDRLLRLQLRDPATNRQVEIRPNDPTGGMQDPPPPEGTDPAASPDWIPFGSGESRDWTVFFPTAKGWDDLASGTWEARVELTAEPDAEDPGAWSGSIATEPIPLVVVESRPVRLRFLVPRELGVQIDPGVAGSFQVGCARETLEPITADVRNGFALGARIKAASIHGIHTSSACFDSDWTLIGAHRVQVDGLPPGSPYDDTFELEIFETAEEQGHMTMPVPGKGSYRTLWKRSFRVTATAAEIEALRR